MELSTVNPMLFALPPCDTYKKSLDGGNLCDSCLEEAPDDDFTWERSWTARNSSCSTTRTTWTWRRNSRIFGKQKGSNKYLYSDHQEIPEESWDNLLKKSVIVLVINQVFNWPLLTKFSVGSLNVTRRLRAQFNEFLRNFCTFNVLRPRPKIMNLIILTQASESRFQTNIPDVLLMCLRFRNGSIIWYDRWMLIQRKLNIQVNFKEAWQIRYTKYSNDRHPRILCLIRWRRNLPPNL